MTALWYRLASGPTSGPRATAALAVRLAAGAVFVVFGIGKFSRHEAEVRSFDSYGLPSPDAFVYVIGAIEIAGGALLLVGLATRLVAAILAGNMVGAIVASGIGEGEPISLTLAPALLAGMAFLLWAGPGARSLDGARAHRRTAAAPRPGPAPPP